MDAFSFRTVLPRLAVLALSLLSTATSLQAQSLTDSSLSMSVYASGFSSATQIRFLGVDDMFVAQKNGAIIHVDHGVKSTAIDLNVTSDSERGLLGLALDPNFATNKYVYAYYSSTTGNADDSGGSTFLDNRLVRMTWNGTTLSTPTLLQTFASSSDGQGGGPNHDGGPITFGPDGKLYGVVGDFNRNGAEQNAAAAAGTSSKVGGIYRLQITNGVASIPTDNPFFNNNTSNGDFKRLYAYGVRNSFGLTFDPVTGKLWDTENGPNVYDEINLVAAGFNSGWKTLMGPDSRNSANASDLVVLAGSAYSDPEFSFLNPVAVTGMSFLAGSSMDGTYHDAAVVGDANNGNLYLFRLNGNRDAFVLSGGNADLVADDVNERNSLLFGSGFSALTDLQVGPDGALYVTDIGSGKIYRVIPEPASAMLLALGTAMFAVARSHRRRSTC